MAISRIFAACMASNPRVGSTAVNLEPLKCRHASQTAGRNPDSRRICIKHRRPSRACKENVPKSDRFLPLRTAGIRCIDRTTHGSQGRQGVGAGAKLIRLRDGCRSPSDHQTSAKVRSNKGFPAFRPDHYLTGISGHSRIGTNTHGPDAGGRCCAAALPRTGPVSSSGAGCAAVQPAYLRARAPPECVGSQRPDAR